MTSAVMDQRGTVDKFIGDAVMAFWNAPLITADHTRCACVCAIKMLDTLTELNSIWKEQGKPNIEIGIGIHCGMARVGNMGSQQRFDYTVMGDAVNLSSRLEGLNKMYGTEILVSDAVYAINQDSDLVFRRVDRVRVKGKAKPVTIYELLGQNVGENEIITVEPYYEEALVSYDQGDFQTAADIFHTLATNYPEDRLYGIHRERCHRLAAEPPEDWDGITNMLTKG